MSPSRRQAAIGLLTTGAAATPLGRAMAEDASRAEAPEIEHGPDERLQAGQDKYTHMMAPVLINGRGPYQFVLDTGANVSCVSHALVEQLDLQPGRPRRVHTIVGVRERPSVVIDELTVGNRARRDVEAPALPIKGPGVDGILGVDWLKGQRLVLDFKKNEIEITKSKSDHAHPGRVVVVPARRKHGQLTIIDADLNGVPISAIIDSGAQGTLCNGPLRDLVRASEQRHGKTGPPQSVRMESLAGEVFHGESVFLPFLRLGGLHLGNVQVTYADMHVFRIWELEKKPALVIGMDLLMQFEQVALDFGRSAVRFEFV
ncbi:aspartyl protease family protein [Phenylobacterium sp. J426]|uniref:retroviral-like aspartic protease family protein n=1 Tax=Phenylobacterium sp. J426 TaxID=2898439 RepID=UPI00215186CB|nr:retroviral-like aspartic protease family protein [Phenylobacterium sp. J426]MCR5875762.1 aspartyl protease family protein [Phenylobacterium sp. J426]